MTVVLIPEVTNQKLLDELDESEKKAWESLARYKFQMFGYWAAIWVHLNRITGANRPNPWSELVKMARGQVVGQHGQGQGQARIMELGRSERQ